MQSDRGIKRIVSSFLDLLYPPRCIGCDELLDHDSDDIFCDKCRKEWYERKHERCRRCNQPIPECWCGVPENTAQIVDGECHLVQYDKSEGIVKNLIYSAKQVANKRNFRAIASEMYNELYPRLENREYIVTAVPRSRKAIKRYGHDQSEMLAKEFSLLSSLSYIDALYHVGEKKQKSLTQKQREENAAKSYKIRAGLTASLKGKNVILIDDVVTTGSSVVRCAKLLKSKGVKRVYVMCIAKTV